MFTSKPKHVHEWSAWNLEEIADDFEGQSGTIKHFRLTNLRHCVLPKCNITQEKRTEDVRD